MVHPGAGRRNAGPTEGIGLRLLCLGGDLTSGSDWIGGGPLVGLKILIGLLLIAALGLLVMTRYFRYAEEDTPGFLYVLGAVVSLGLIASGYFVSRRHQK